MKQLFTFLCAMMMILSANAAPQRNTKALLKQKQAKTQTLRVQKQQKQVKGTTFKWGQHLFAKPAFTSTFSDTRFARRVPRRASTNVTISDYTATFCPAHEEVGNTVFYGLRTADFSKSFYFSIFTAEGKHDVELGKTYTLADMEKGANEWDDEEWNSHDYTEATFTKTKGENYDVHISATVTDEDGDTYILSYDEDPVTVTGNTITLNIENPMTGFDYSNDGTWFLRAENDNYSAQFSYYSDDNTSLAGNFSGDDIDFYNSFISVNTGKLDQDEDPIWETLRVLEASYQVTETDQRIDAKGTLLASDGNTYDVTMFYVKPHAETTTTITATNLAVQDFFYDWFGQIYLTASDDKNSVKLTFYPEGLDEKMAGTYVVGLNGVEATIVPADEENQFPDPINIFSGQFTVTYDAGNIHVTGTLLGYNNVEYTLNLSYTKPVATRQQTLTFPAIQLYISWSNWQAIGYNADETQLISIAADLDESVAGTYRFRDLKKDYNYVVTDINGEDGNVFTLLDANVNVTYDESTKTAHITGTMLCQNMRDETDIPEFTIDVTASVPAPYLMDNKNADFKEDFVTYETDTDYLADEGIIYVNTRNDNDAIAALEFWVAEGVTTLAPGTYLINDSHQPQTVSMSEGTNDAGNILYSFVGHANEKNELSDIWFLVSGTVTIDENGVITIEAVNSNGKKINSVIGNTDAGISNATTEKSVNSRAAKFLEKGRLFIEKNGQRFNALGIEMK